MKNNRSGNWIFLCNPKYYMIDKAFNENTDIYWHQIKTVNNISVGSIVYIYVSGGIKQIKYKCVVVDKDIIEPENYDSSYSLEKLKLDSFDKQHKYLLLRLVSKIDNDELNLNFLKTNGITCFIGPISLSYELDNKINNLL